MKKRGILFVALVLAGGARAAPEKIGMPPLAAVVDRDQGADRWQVTGDLPGGLSVARRDFGLCLDRQGWSKESVTVTGGPGEVLSLSAWKKGERRLLLMLWERDAGRTRFSLGEEGRDKDKRKDG